MKWLTSETVCSDIFPVRFLMRGVISNMAIIDYKNVWVCLLTF